MASVQDANKALVRRVYAEWWNASGNPASVDEMVRPDFIGHLDNGKVRTIDTLRHDIAVFQSALGGLREEVEDMIAEGDLFQFPIEPHTYITPKGQRVNNWRMTVLPDP